MSIYSQEDYTQVIERIKSKITLKKIKMGAVLSEKQILDFEERCHIQLPQAYRIFLQEVGNGCIMVDDFPLKILEEIEVKDLSQPFMLEDAWLWEEDDELTEQELDEKIELMVYNGEIELISIGDGMSYNLIVSGKCRGEVWNFTDVGVQPCCERQDFLGWFELWLDEQDSVDYFKDYEY